METKDETQTHLLIYTRFLYNDDLIMIKTTTKTEEHKIAHFFCDDL